MDILIKEPVDMHLVVLGDLMLDKYTTGMINRMSPEAPIPVLDDPHDDYVLGGSANVCANLLALGTKVSLIGMIGDDAPGNRLKSMIAQTDITFIPIIEARKTTVKHRFISNQKQLLRVDTEDRFDVNKDSEKKIITNLSKLISTQKIDGVILQDYDKGFFTPELIEEIIALCNQSSIPTFVDPKFKNFWHYKNCTLLKPNKKELEQANPEIDTMEELLSKTSQGLDCDHLICTLANDGMVHHNTFGTTYMNTETINVVDVSGAGDTTMAVLVIGLLQNISIKDLLKIANCAGRIVCLKNKVSVVSFKELTQCLNTLL